MAWVGNGYRFALDACDAAKKGIEDNSDARGFVWLPVSWAGAQRCGVLWSGDQQLSWDYIRWQIPTYAGATMSGIAYNTGDVGSIYRHDAKMYARDLQWKAFLPAIMTMDGWATDLTTKKPADQQPWLDGEPYTSINRKYLQLKERLLPYMYTLSRQAADTGVGAVRPLWLEYPDDPGTLAPTPRTSSCPAPTSWWLRSTGTPTPATHLSAEGHLDRLLDRPHVPGTDDGERLSRPAGHPPAVRARGRDRAHVAQGTTSWQTRDRHELDWDLYPSAHATSHYTLYEDDGVSRDFAKGAAAPSGSPCGGTRVGRPCRSARARARTRARWPRGRTGSPCTAPPRPRAYW